MNPKNRLEKYFKKEASLKGRENSKEIIKDAAMTFFHTCNGCETNLLYVQLAEMVASLIIGHTHKGAEETICNGFKLLLDKKLKDIIG